MAEYKGVEQLSMKLTAKRKRVALRCSYYDMKNIAKDLSNVMPKQFSWLSCVLGWCAKAVDSVSDRIVFENFGNDILDLNGIYNQNNKDVMTDDAVNSALKTSCGFIYIAKDDKGYPRLQTIDGGNATGVIDPVTRMLTEGYAVLERNDSGLPSIEAYFTKEYTQIIRPGYKDQFITNKAPYPLLVPVIHRHDATRPFGRSRISRACMELTDSAMRTLKRSEVAAEFYSFPQKYVLGLDNDAEMQEKWALTISSFLQYGKGKDGDKPTVGQFQQQSMSPYNDQLKTIASMFAGETGLTLDDLGFSTANPSTPEAIRASHETLRLAARKAQRDFATGFKNAGYLAACIRDNHAYDRSVINDITVNYEPLFEPDAAQLTGMGDAVLKIQQAFPDYFDEDKLHRLTGL